MGTKYKGQAEVRARGHSIARQIQLQAQEWRSNPHRSEENDILGGGRICTNRIREWGPGASESELGEELSQPLVAFQLLAPIPKISLKTISFFS